MKFTKEHQKKLDLADKDIERLKDEGAHGVIVYESSQMVLDQWTLCYTTFHSGSVERLMRGMSRDVSEGKIRNPLALYF